MLLDTGKNVNILCDLKQFYCLYLCPRATYQTKKKNICLMIINILKLYVPNAVNNVNIQKIFLQIKLLTNNVENVQLNKKEIFIIVIVKKKKKMIVQQIKKMKKMIKK